MLFNSLEFAVFLPIAFLLYWFAFSKNAHWQNLFIIVAGYFFYAWCDIRFLGLIILVSVTTWGSGLLIEHFRNCEKPIPPPEILD